ncbi:gliding motility-associated C-terminal domain-containing protein [Prolixibacteraceae bacterium Z1-6]|uniref:Gliding motility-associated C-terminal domain-containing protein n=1 Tax=Draconibacterium aestuarii TaxID=2998507 RepID=A0A9X3F730_9BACT|nr:gliding motility-associated C-terminal domain-containing protein [Prolixibacteraceae bacterium Z1-6]
MNPFFAWLIKSSLSLVLLYSLFRLTMRNDRNHTLNRFLLLSILLVSAVIPFLNIRFFYNEISPEPLQTMRELVSVPVQAAPVSVNTVLPVAETREFFINPWLTFYLLVILALISRLVVGVVQVSKIIRKAEKRRLQKIVLAVVKDLIQPFTFLNKVVLSEKDFTENKNIIVAHEHAHIKHLHAIDLVVCELFTVLHFFNPFMWLLRHDLKLIHEYQADEAVLNKGIDAQKYQLLVLEKAVGERRFAMANHFTQKPILKRLKMMAKTKHRSWGGVKLLLFVPLIAVLLQAFARPELITGPDDFIPVKYTEDKSEKWLANWTADNIGKGFYQPDLKDKDAPRNPNNVLVILMNRNDEFLIDGQYHKDNNIKQIVKDYLHGINPYGKKGPDYEVKEIPFVGKMKVAKGIILYQHDLASSKEKVNHTLRSIGEACLEVRKEKAQLLFGKNYFDLDDEKQAAVDMAVPVWFSYESPKGPNPSVWLPFDGKPSDDPKPIEIKVNSNGQVIVANHTFHSYEAFKENVVHWDKELDKFNKGKTSKGFYRTHISFEAEVPHERQEEINLLLYRNNVHVEHINVEAPKQVSLEQDKLSFQQEQKRAQIDRELAKTENQKLKKVIVHLNQNKLNFNGKFCKLENIKTELEKYIEKNPEKKTVELVLHQPAELSEEITEKVKEELNKIDGVEVKVMAVEVMDIKKDSQPKEKTDRVSELFIPNGFSPNDDGIHDFFEIKGIYPQYPNAKLAIFNSQGQKVFEKQNYGNIDVWGKGKEWWDGTSENDKLSAGNYNYVLELDKGKVQKGTVMLALSPPPQVLEVMPENPQYPIPSIRFHEKWVSVNREGCELADLKNVLENLLPTDGTQRKVELVVYSTVSKERVEQIYAELQNVDDIEIIQKDVTPPPPPPLKPITLKKNGTVSFGGKDYSFEEFEQRIMAIEIQHRIVSNKNDIEKYRLRAKVKIETGTKEESIIRFKEIMKKGNFTDISYSII